MFALLLICRCIKCAMEIDITVLKQIHLCERYLYQAQCFPVCFSGFLFRCGICIKSKPSLA